MKTITSIKGLLAMMLILASTIFSSHAGLIAQYNFTGNADDSSGNSNHATVSGATLTAGRLGNSNQAYFFDGINDSISTGLLRESYQGDFSISAWFKYQGNVTDGYRPIVAGGLGMFFLGKETSNSNLTMQNGNHVADLATVPDAWNGEWHHVAAVFDGTSPGSDLTGSVFLDGFSVGSAGYSNANSAAGGLFIGHEVTGPVGYFPGVIDDVGFYDHALTTQEISSLAAVPEPSSFLMFSLFASIVMGRRRRVPASSN